MTIPILYAAILTNPTSTTIVPAGWQSIQAGVQTFINNGQTTLPDGISVTNDQISNVLTVNRSSTLRKNQISLNEPLSVQATLKFEITTSDDFPLASPVTLIGNAAVTVGAETSTHNETAIASASSAYSPESVIASSEGNLGEDSKQSGPKSTKFQRVYPQGLQWFGPGEEKKATAEVLTQFYQSNLSTSYGGPFGGNMAVAVSKANCQVKLAITLMNVNSQRTFTANKQSFETAFWVWVGAEKWTVDTDLGPTLVFDYSEYSNGAHDLYFKTAKSLRKKVTQSFVSGPINLGDLNLVYGDLNGDNAISSSEVAWVNLSLGSSALNGDWGDLVELSGGTRLSKQMADINQDGQVNSADVALVAGNSGLVGD